MFPVTFLIQGASIFLGRHDWAVSPIKKEFYKERSMSGLKKEGKGIEILIKMHLLS